MSLSDIDDVPVDICMQHEHRIRMPSDFEAFTLSYRIELGSYMGADDLAPGIVLITGLLYMLFAASVSLDPRQGRPVLTSWTG